MSGFLEDASFKTQIAGVRRRRSVQCRQAARRSGGALRARREGACGLRDGLRLGRDARPRSRSEREPAQAQDDGRQGQPYRLHRIPSRLSRADGEEHRLGHPQRRARRQRAHGTAHQPRHAALSRDAGRERPSLPDHHDPRLHRRTEVRARAAGEVAGQDRLARLRQAGDAVVGEDRRNLRHGHDRAAGRHRCARQHHRGGTARRPRRDQRPQVVHVGADVRCLPGAGAGAKRRQGALASPPAI